MKELHFRHQVLFTPFLGGLKKNLPLIALVTLFLGLATTIYADTSDFDPIFGQNGVVVPNIPGQFSKTANTIAVRDVLQWK